ncbi:MAG: response regulator [Alphaproteobacteria bacterium]|nr:response regulator [Alphaproteobacteria bacterium]
MHDDKPHILIVDDDDRLRALLKKFLCEQGFMVSVAASTKEAREQLGWFVFDVMILDVMMPGETGLELLTELRRKSLPVLMLSAMGEADDRIAGLEAGAEDYLTKPFEPKELVLRLRTILKRSEAAGGAVLPQVAFGDFVFDTATNQLKKTGQSVALTSAEAALLKQLIRYLGTPVAREQLAAVLPGSASERSIDVQITRLRKKIEDSEGKPLHLQTIRGEGYVLYGRRL